VIRNNNILLTFSITFTYQGVADQKTSEILGAYHRLEKVWSHVRPKIEREREREKQIDKQRHRDSAR
jgi:hypothetical protein